jgi:hypothetical protein
MSGTTDFARPGENALVTRWQHPFFLRPLIARLLRDAALRERLGATGPETAAAWTWETLAAKLLAYDHIFYPCRRRPHGG